MTTLLLILISLMLAHFIIPMFDDEGSQEENSRASGSWVSKTEGEVTFFLPGILARASDQLAPVRTAFADSAAICAVDYTGLRLKPGKVAENVAAHIDTILARGQRVHLVGVSLGGVLVPSIVQKLTVSQANLRISFVDPPAGTRTLAAIPRFVALLAKWLFCSFKPGRLTNKLYGNRVMSLMTVPPKPENIEVPMGKNPERYKDEVIAKAKAGLLGHNFSMWWSQLAFMSKSVPYEALKDVTQVTYYWCGLGDENANDVVRQPLARDIWAENVPNLKLKRVESTHAGFLEKQATWLKAFSSAE